jgi:uncharacterized membrane protein HdeD (DUF308 family)
MPRTSWLLGLAGLIPFVAGLLAFIYLEDYPKALGQHAFLLYSLAILSFLAGTTWGWAQAKRPRDGAIQLLVSNGIVVFAVLAMLTANPFWALVLLSVAYLVFLGYERRVLEQGPDYRRMRVLLTLCVVLLHGFMAAFVSSEA